MTNIITSTLSLLFNKARDVAASQFSEGDLTDEGFRKIIAREIDEIKSKLNGLARKDLLSSRSFLKEGLTRLALAVRKKSVNFDTPTATQNGLLITNDAVEDLTAVDGATTSQQCLNKACNLSNALARNLEVVSVERLENAKESFVDSRHEATRAFNNAALTIDDRIMAGKLRIVSRILESFLEDPDAGGNDCLLYLEELHSLPAVREIFSVHVGGGLKSYLKSFFKEEERRQIVESIESINSAMLDFIVGFTNKEFFHNVNWPTIKLRNKEEYTIISKEMITKRHAEISEYFRMNERWPNFKIHDNPRANTWRWRYDSPGSRTLFIDRPFVMTENLNARLREEVSSIEIMESHREMTFANMPCEVKNALCLTVDALISCIYVLTYVQKSQRSALVFIIRQFSSDGTSLENIKTDLDCCSSSSCIGSFAMHTFETTLGVLRDLYDCRRVNFINSNTGQTYHTIFLPPEFQDVDRCFGLHLTISENVLMVTSSDAKTARIYLNDGHLYEIIQLPLEDNLHVWDAAFNGYGEEIIFLTTATQDSSREEQLLGCRLLVYSTNGTPQDSYGLSNFSLGDEAFFRCNLLEGLVLVGHSECFHLT